MQKGPKIFRRSILIVIPVLIAVSCVPPSVIQPPMSASTADDYQADLTAVESTVKVISAESIETEVPQGGNVNVWVDDRIDVGGGSRAILNFPDFLDVELYRSAQLHLADAKLESGGAISVHLDQYKGHVGVSLRDRAHTRVTLATEDAVIKTLENGTEFIVCANPGVITCVGVLKGSIEVVAQGKKEILRAGEASYIRPGQPPVSAICAPQTIFQDWKVRMRDSSDTLPISKVVDRKNRDCDSRMSITATYIGFRT